MTIKKIAILDVLINQDSIIPIEKIAENNAVHTRFRKITDQLREEQTKVSIDIGKQLSPKVDDFLYAHCIMMHAAEAALIDQENGGPVLNKKGEPVTGNFISFKDSNGKESVKWESSDEVLPYRNGNGDIFPEEDLLKAHKDWIGKPLCRDHMSNSVEGIRGIVVDTYYDPKFKRVHALFALDRRNYAELARKVEAGYATSVSMGTAVGRSICSECGNVATTEPEYCHHVRTKTCHGEVNKDLSPIELSIVVTGADPKAKIMTVLAALQEYESTVQKVAAGKEEKSVLKTIYEGLNKLGEDLSPAGQARNDALTERLKPMLAVAKDANQEVKDHVRNLVLAELKEEGIEDVEKIPFGLVQAADASGIKLMSDEQAVELAAQEAGIGPLEGPGVQPGLVGREVKPVNEMGVDQEGYKAEGQPVPQFGFGMGPEAPPQAFAALFANKIASLKQDIKNLENQVTREKIMSFADLKKAQNDRTAYWQGTEEPTPGKPQYPLMGDQDAIRERDDKQMNQTGPLGGMDGLVPGDEQTKREWQRVAELKDRMAKRAQWLKKATTTTTTVNELGTDSAGNKLVQDTVSKEVFTEKSNPAADGKIAAKKDDDKDDKKKKDEDDDKKDDKKKKDEDDDKKESLLDFARKLIAEAESDKKDDDKDEDDKDDKKDEDDDDKKKDNDKDKEDNEDDARGPVVPGTEGPADIRATPGGTYETPGVEERPKPPPPEKKAYWQGTEEPTPGKPQYPLMGDQDGIREREDKQMNQTGPLGGMDGLVPGDEQTKGEWQRMAGKIGAKLFKGASPEKSRWEFSQNGQSLFSLSANQAYGTFLNDKFSNNSTYSDLFHSKDYGTRVMKMLRNDGLQATASELGVNLVKRAQDPLAAPAPDVGVEPAAVAPAEEEKSADEKLKDLSALISELEEVTTSIMEAAGTKPTPEEEGLGEVDVAAGEPAVEPMAGGLPEPGAVVSFRAKDLLEAYASVSDATNELCFIEAKAREKKQDGQFYAVAEQAIHDAKIIVKEAKELVTQIKLASRVKAREKIVRKAMGYEEHMPEMPGYEEQMAEAPPGWEQPADAPVENPASFVLDDEELEQVEEVAEEVFLDLEKKPHDEYDHGGEEKDVMMGGEEDDYDMAHTPMHYANLDAAGRKAWRESLVVEAKKGGKWDDIYTEQRSGGGHTLEGLGMSVADNGDKVEAEHEVHEAMENIATKPLGKIKEAAEKLDKWIKSGGININKLDMLVAEGAVDSEVVKYWKTYYGEVEGGKEWATQLVSDFDKRAHKTASLEEVEAQETRIHRAYALGIEAQKKGIIGQTQSELSQYVETLKAVPEESFNALKNHVGLLKAPQQLVSAPLVGITEKEAGLTKDANVNTFAPTIENLSKIFG
jgi:hypothetical protein